MDRFVEHKPRLKGLRRVHTGIFRESQKLFQNPKSFGLAQEPKGTMGTLGTTHRKVTPIRANTPVTSGLYSGNYTREYATPLQTLNQNQDIFSEADDLSKKTSHYSSPKERRKSVRKSVRKSWPARDECSHPNQGAPQPPEPEPPSYSFEATSYGSPIPCYDEVPVYAGGYLEDDFSIPPPPPQHPSSFTSHHYYEDYPSPHFAMSKSQYYEPLAFNPTPEPDCRYYSRPMTPVAYSPVPHAYHEPLHQEKIVDVSEHRRSPVPGELQELDIVCGRGAPTNYHYGNQAFKDLVEEYQTQYLCAKRTDKPQLAMKIMDIVKDRGARFVKRVKTSGPSIWVEIDPKGAYEKVCQALRQGAPESRGKMLSVVAASRMGATKSDE
jgi:hypothetical protein